ncbi:glycosyltransferase family 4 protein [Methylophaga lonarensis]|nr:glycosyltransferase family 4 protein [Methylophaga lonarensis]
MYLLNALKIKDEITIGWIGTPKTCHYLLSLIPVFENLKARYDIRFVAVGANTEEFQDTPIETWPWSQESEVTSIQQFDIGIMPLIDSPWERGKCGYKLIQYMACGLPVVASPVGVNTEIVRERINGYLATNDDEWEEALIKLCTDTETRLRMGLAGREMVEQQYSIKSQSTKLLSAIKQAMQ